MSVATRSCGEVGASLRSQARTLRKWRECRFVHRDTNSDYTKCLCGSNSLGIEKGWSYRPTCVLIACLNEILRLLRAGIQLRMPSTVMQRILDYDSSEVILYTGRGMNEWIITLARLLGVNQI